MSATKEAGLGVNVDVYTIKGIKIYEGTDGQALNATLCRNGKAVCKVIDEGCGGMIHHNWLDWNAATPKEADLFEQFIAAETEKKSDVVVPGKNYDMSPRALFDADIFVWDLVNEAQNDKRMKRHCKTKTLFQVDAEIGTDTFHTVKGVGPEVRAHLEKKYVGKKLYVLNDKFDKTTR